MAIDLAKLQRLEHRLAVKEPAARALSVEAQEESYFAKDVRAKAEDALRLAFENLPQSINPRGTLAELLASLEALGDRRAYAAIGLLRQALDAETRAAALQAEAKKLLADLAPLRDLLAACRAFVSGGTDALTGIAGGLWAGTSSEDGPLRRGRGAGAFLHR